MARVVAMFGGVAQPREPRVTLTMLFVAMGPSPITGVTPGNIEIIGQRAGFGGFDPFGGIPGIIGGSLSPRRINDIDHIPGEPLTTHRR